MRAEEAYETARHRIAEAREHGSERLSLSDLTDLERLPPEIGDLPTLALLGLENTRVTDLSALRTLKGLRELVLAGAEVSDIAPLAGLSGLQTLDLDNTQVNDIAPLAGLSGLQTLWLSNTQVSGIAPLAGLERLLLDRLPLKTEDLVTLVTGNPDLISLSLTGTAIADLRPLLRLAKLERLWFEGTPFAVANAETPALALLNSVECAKQTRAYLETLPPWPEPLPWNRSDSSPASGDGPPHPGNKPAPVMVRLSSTGRIIDDPPEHAFEDAMLDRAEQAWEALRAYLEDLAEFRAGLSDNVPKLRSAFDSLERALGTDFADLNEIDLGMQAERLRLLAQDADVYLMDQDPTELKAFTAQLGLYMQRFNVWIVYQDDTPEPAIEYVPEDRADFEALTENLTKTEQVDDAVLAKLEDVTETGTSPDASPLERKGALDSHVNMLDTISERALAEKTALDGTEGGLRKELEAASLGAFVGGTLASPAAAGSVYAIIFVYNNQERLERMASRYPSLRFLTEVLRFLFPA